MLVYNSGIGRFTLEKIAMVEIAAAIAAYMVGMPALVFTGARKLCFEAYHLAGR